MRIRTRSSGFRPECSACTKLSVAKAFTLVEPLLDSHIGSGKVQLAEAAGTEEAATTGAGEAAMGSGFSSGLAADAVVLAALAGALAAAVVQDSKHRIQDVGFKGKG